jgi:hypothetical protein
LHMKGLLKSGCEVSTSLRCFYTKEREEGRFLIRSLDQIESAVSEPSFAELESQQQLKRANPERSKTPPYELFDYYADRSSFHKKLKTTKRLVLVTTEKVDLAALKQLTGGEPC